METQRPHWLAGEDVTTVANHRRATVAEAPPDRARRAGRTSRADALVFLAAVWLVVASVPLSYQRAGRYDLFWNDAVVGIALGVVTMTRMIGPTAPPGTAGITCALGTWLVAAPFVLGAGGGLAFWNDLAVGAAVVTLSLASMATAASRTRA